jgi:hypothetical protein
MIETLKKMDMVMPLELWGIAIGLVLGMILWMGFLAFISALISQMAPHTQIPRFGRKRKLGPVIMLNCQSRMLAFACKKLWVLSTKSVFNIHTLKTKYCKYCSSHIHKACRY